MFRVVDTCALGHHREAPVPQHPHVEVHAQDAKHGEEEQAEEHDVGNHRDGGDHGPDQDAHAGQDGHGPQRSQHPDHPQRADAVAHPGHGADDGDDHHGEVHHVPPIFEVGSFVEDETHGHHLDHRLQREQRGEERLRVLDGPVVTRAALVIDPDALLAPPPLHLERLHRAQDDRVDEDGGKDDVLEPRGLDDFDAPSADLPRNSVLIEGEVPERPFLAVELLEPGRGRYAVELVDPHTPDFPSLLLRVVEGKS